MIQGMLTGMGHFVQCYRVREYLQRVNPLSCLLRHYQPISRRKYSVPYPNSLWHIDGHNSLICWGFVSHGGVDGFLPSVYLYCSTNNKADTGVLSTDNYPFWGTLKGAIGSWRRERGYLQVHDLLLWC